jgi:uncharacterized protein YceK
MQQKDKIVLIMFICIIVFGCLSLVAKISAKMNYVFYYEKLVEETINKKVLNSCMRKYGR